MKWIVSALAAGAGALLLAGATPNPAAAQESWLATDQKCLECHDESSEKPVLAIFQTPHGMRGDSRTPFGSGQGCAACHGDGSAHMRSANGEERAPLEVVFEPGAPPGPKNAACLQCHEGGARMHWQGSAHETNETACSDCHQVHASEDPMLVKDRTPGTWRHGQAETCFGCHPQQRAQMHRTSAHPIKEGVMRCSDCHNTHGTIGDAQLAGLTLNQTCYDCHAEKRGPFLWEHQPAREDCSTCHVPHGSNHPALLAQRAPFLCQQCHMAAFHPSTAYTAEGLPGPSPDEHLLSRSCMNCHPEVHGSNHPSGPRFTR